MNYIFVMIIIFFVSSCTTVASNIGKKLPRKLEDAKVYQMNDSTWVTMMRQLDKRKDFLVNNNLELDISYHYMSSKINSIISYDKHPINFFQEEINNIDSIQHIPILKKDDRNIFILREPIFHKTDDNKSFTMSIKYYMKKQIIDAGIFSLPIEKTGILEFSFAPEIKNNILYLNTKFERAEGGILDSFSSFIFKGFINLFLKGLNEFEIPEEYLEVERIAFEGSAAKLGYKVYNINALAHAFNDESMQYKINSDFSIFFNDSGFIEIDTLFQPTLNLDINVIQSAVDQMMADRGHRFYVREDTINNDFFYFNSIKVASDSNKIALHTSYKGKIPLTIFDYGISGELDMIVHPVILNNKLYLKFDKFIFYGDQKETDILSQVLNVLISETIQKSLYIDLNAYLPEYNDVLVINDEVSIQHVQALFTKGMVKDGKIYIFSKMSAMLKFN